jgi:hypothetical protein
MAVTADSTELRIMTRMSMAVLPAVLAVCTIAARGPAAVAGPLQSQAVFQGVFYNPFSGNGEVRGMTECNGKLYIAVGGLDQTKTPVEPILRIYRMASPGCMSWQDVTPNWEKRQDYYNMGMAAFGGYLVVGTRSGEVRPVDLPEITTLWHPPPSPTQTDGGVACMTVFQDKLYAVTEKLILYRGGWSPVTSSPTAPQVFKWENLGRAKVDVGSGLHTDMASVLEVFNGFLYMGFGVESNSGSYTGIQVWRTGDGKNWEKDLDKPSGQHVHAMKSFGGYLYVGKYEGWTGFYRTNGTLGNWEEVPVDGLNVASMEIHDGKLFAGYYHSQAASGAVDKPLLFWSSDGKAWTGVTGFLLTDGKKLGIRSMASCNGRLYTGTADPSTGGQVFEVGDSLSTCPKDELRGWIREPLLWNPHPDIWQSPSELRQWQAHLGNLGAVLGRVRLGPGEVEAAGHLKAARRELDAAAELVGRAAGFASPQDRAELVRKARMQVEAARADLAIP